jgi:hypothetical protein
MLGMERENRAMRRFFALVLPLVSACVLPTLEPKDKGSDAGGSDAGSSDAAPKVTGAGCSERAPGVSLCAAISTCPNVVVDPDQFPRCGFRIRGTAIDLECACGTALCPMGVPTTCEQAARLLDSQNEFLVCAQVDEGRCTPTR